MSRVAILLGMPRAATTFLYHHFDSHPNLFVPFRRKTNYFSLHYERGLEWFYEHFKSANDSQVIIDTETLGFIDKKINIEDRIEATLGEDAKLILCVREPGEWAFSLYKQISTFDKNIISFPDFLNGKYVLVEDDVSIPFNYKNGDIKLKIDSLIKHFGARLLLIDYKEIKKNPNKVLIKIESFLGVRGFYKQHPVTSEKINASDKRHSIIVSQLLRNKTLIWLLSLFPASFVKKIRKFYDTKVTKNTLTVVKVEESSEVIMANEYFKDDLKYYNDLFINDKD